MSTRRKLAIATWGAPDEGPIYGKLTVDATEAVAYLAHVRATTGEKITLTHLVGTPFARVPVLVLVGAVRDGVVAIDGAPVVRKQLTITATIDHRFLDGFQGGVLAKVVRDQLENPWQLDGIERPVAASGVG
jgi:hypothetical protein